MSLQHLICEESDRARFFLLEEKAREDLCAVFSYQVGGYRENKGMLISHVPSTRVRDSGHNWEKEKFQLDIKKKVLRLFWGFSGAEKPCVYVYICSLSIFRHGNRATGRLLNHSCSELINLSCSELDWAGPEQHDLTWKSFSEGGFEQNSLQKSLPI